MFAPTHRCQRSNCIANRITSTGEPLQALTIRSNKFGHSPTQDEYLHRWAHSPAEEKAAFEMVRRLRLKSPRTLPQPPHPDPATPSKPITPTTVTPLSPCAPRRIAHGNTIDRPALTPGTPSGQVAAQQARIEELVQKLTHDIPADAESRTEHQAARWLLANLLDWHRREDKVAFPEKFRLEGVRPYARRSASSVNFPFEVNQLVDSFSS